MQLRKLAANSFWSQSASQKPQNNTLFARELLCVDLDQLIRVRPVTITIAPRNYAVAVSWQGSR